MPRHRSEAVSFITVLRIGPTFRGVTERPVRPEPSSEASSLLGILFASIRVTASLQAKAALIAGPHGRVQVLPSVSTVDRHAALTAGLSGRLHSTRSPPPVTLSIGVQLLHNSVFFTEESRKQPVRLRPTERPGTPSSEATFLIIAAHSVSAVNSTPVDSETQQKTQP